MIKVELPDIEISNSIVEIWAHLTPQQQELLRDQFTVYLYKKREVIYCEGEVPTHLLCLLSGKVKVFKEGIGGREQIIRFITPINYFGYRAYFAQGEYVTCASAVEATQICTIPMKIIEQLIYENNDVAMFFIRQLSADLGIADERTVNLTQKHVRGRLAESLLFLKDNYGLEEDNCTLSIYLSREDLANLSNMTTSNAIRTLSNFVNEHLIAMDGRKIKLIDEERLKKISKIG
ncbi:MAG: Crp/Fnr family transcriptional regulator [Prevotellaceae bacterium]|jgi:CRP-like cAMP-binding protein|nr:Crp/Fnr family transcriptional regulator [Prevotellaceae bacterium]